MREYSFFDKLCISFDQALRTMSDVTLSQVPYPAANVEEKTLSPQEQKHAAGLMRVNHTGEVCAQALYHGQSLVTANKQLRQHLQQAAIEEGNHLAWCKQRLAELGSHTSYLNPLWYTGSFCIGVAAGMIGDPWSLGFVVETERQVIQHLQKHLSLLPTQDVRSYKILSRMEADEAQHRDEALQAGARELPTIVKKLMSLSAKLMVKTTYWV